LLSVTDFVEFVIDIPLPSLSHEMIPFVIGLTWCAVIIAMPVIVVTLLYVRLLLDKS